MTDLETYLLDQFPLRDTWRTLKEMVRFDVFRQLDNNGIYLSGDSVCKMETELKEDQIQYAAGKNQRSDGNLSRRDAGLLGRGSR